MRILPRHTRILPTTIVTGASSGIGFALATQLAHRGVRVIALGRSHARLQDLSAQHPSIHAIAIDLNDLDAIPSLVARIIAQHPDTGCVIHNAGIQCNLRLDDASYAPAQIRDELNINLAAPLIFTHALLPHLQSKQASWIVNITSALGYCPKPTSAVYSTTKAGLHLFTQALRVQMYDSPVRVVEAVMPLVDTPMTKDYGSNKLSATQAAQALIAGLFAGHSDIFIGKTRALPLLQRWAPGVLRRIMQRS